VSSCEHRLCFRRTDRDLTARQSAAGDPAEVVAVDGDARTVVAAMTADAVTMAADLEAAGRPRHADLLAANLKN